MADSGRKRQRPIHPVRFMLTEFSTSPRNARSLTVDGNAAENVVIDGIEKELDRLAAVARNGADWQERRAARWAPLYYSFGVVAAILAGVAGATALASTTNRVTAGIIALASAGIGGAATFLNSRNHQQHHRNIAAAWSILYRDVNLIITLELPTVQTAVRQSRHSSVVRRFSRHSSDATQKQVQQLQGRVKELQNREQQLVTDSAQPYP